MSNRLARCIVYAIGTALAVGCAATARHEVGGRLKKVTFTFQPGGSYRQVYLSGTFNGWSPDATPMDLKGDTYVVTLPLRIGTYQYKFVADGQWITDENAQSFHPDGFGGRNSVIVVDESFPDWDLRVGDGRILTEGLSHGSHPWERALGSDSIATVRLRVWSNDIEKIEICWGKELSELIRSSERLNCEPMRFFDTDGIYDYYQANIDLSEFFYFFKVIDGNTVFVFDRGAPRRFEYGGISPFGFEAPGPSLATPDWVKTSVIYQIFPERFANGDPGNDPDFSEWYYEGVTQLPASGKTNGEYFHLVDDWYDVSGLKLSPYRTDGKPDWNSFYGGDLEGIRANLDYLTDLGITAIYLNPIFQAKSNHKYDAATYMKVDPHFGSNQEFKQLVEECHQRNIRIILDLAINHTGHTFWAFVDARKRGRDSQYWNWYEWKSWPVPGDSAWAPPNPLDYYKCWWGFGQMPSLNFDLARPDEQEASVADINDAQPNWQLVDFLLDVATYWLTEMDVDGFRLDVANEVPLWFWEIFRKRVKEVKPSAYIVGELWGASPSWVSGKYFDAVMNYRFFREPVLGFIAKGTMDAHEFDQTLAQGRLIYPEEGVRAMMNLLGSHDTERFLTAAGGDIRKIKLAFLFSLTYVGVPTIYYGDEIGMTGGGDPDCRQPFYWRWMEESERLSLHDYVRSLVRLRRQNPCLTQGTFERLLAQERIYAYRRRLGSDEVIVILNTRAKPAQVSILLDGATAYFDLLDGTRWEPEPSNDGKVLTVSVDAMSGRLLSPEGTR